MRRFTAIFAALCLPFLTLAIGWQLGLRYQLVRESQAVQAMQDISQPIDASGTVIGDPEEEVDLGLLWTVWRTLQSHYIYPQDLHTSDMVLGAVKGLVEAVGDPYTVFMSPKENKDFRDSLSGELHGIGAELSQKNGATIIVSPLKASPAEEAGLKAGDRILAINGEPTDDLSLPEVVQKVRGPAGTTVTLTILSEGSTDARTVTIERREIKVPSVESSIVDSTIGPVGVIHLNQFGSESAEDVRSALVEQEEKGVKGLILDLRGNGGGYLDGAVDIVSLFLAEGDVVSVQSRDGELQTHTVSGNSVDTETPMVVLINQGSASASEITAGALQDTKRAVLIGMKSYGKGSVQEILELPGGSSLRVTYARWLTPAGRDISKEGIEPDIAVDFTAADAEAKRDPQMDRAILWLESPEKALSSSAPGNSVMLDGTDHGAAE